jgi:hypothetical protein
LHNGYCALTIIACFMALKRTVKVVAVGHKKHNDLYIRGKKVDL